MIGLACPHCESALLIPDECRTAQVQCAVCRAPVPNPAQPNAPAPGRCVALSLEQEIRAERKDRLQRFILVVLTACGTTVSSILVGLLAESILALLLTAPVFVLVSVASIRLTLQSRPSLSCVLGWVIVLSFAFLGGCGVLGALAALIVLAVWLFII